jgi:hypothetical protein
MSSLSNLELGCEAWWTMERILKEYLSDEEFWSLRAKLTPYLDPLFHPLPNTMAYDVDPTKAGYRMIAEIHWAYDQGRVSAEQFENLKRLARQVTGTPTQEDLHRGRAARQEMRDMRDQLLKDGKIKHGQKITVWHDAVTRALRVKDHHGYGYAIFREDCRTDFPKK